MQGDFKSTLLLTTDGLESLLISGLIKSLPLLCDHHTYRVLVLFHLIMQPQFLLL